MRPLMKPRLECLSLNRGATVYNRRGLLAGLALSAMGMGSCARKTTLQKSDPSALKTRYHFPIGAIAKTADLRDQSFTSLLTTHFDHFTPEWEMKMEYMLQDGGQVRFDAPDQLLSFAKAHDLRVHGHTLIWYDQDKSPYFQSLKANKSSFSKAYNDYIAAVMSHYKGQLMGMDVVNEALDEDGQWRPCLWLEVLGPDYIEQAFRAAKAADAATPLFINDYNLESNPKKRLAFMKRVEALLKRDVPIDGIGTQTHIDANLPPEALTLALKDLASLGLKLHVSEVDISLYDASHNPFNLPRLRQKQIALIHELTKAYGDLPEAQRYGLTFWGMRDRDSWLTRRPDAGWDEPNLFDTKGQIKPI